MDVTLVLTHACSLACTYCYAGEKTGGRMPRALAMRAIELAFTGFADRPEGPRRPAITFFGGEPLLAWDLLLEAAKEARVRARERGLRLALQVTTNGTHLDRARARSLAELGVHVALSIDGVREAHEATRPNAGGGSSFAKVSAALDALVELAVPFDVIAVVDPSQVRWLGASVRALLDRGVTSLTLNPNWDARWSDDDRRAWRDGYEAAAAVQLAWLRRGRRVAIQPLDSAAQGLIKGTRDAGDVCGAGELGVAVAPSGRLYACARMVGEDDGALSIGHLDRGIDPARVAEVTGGARSFGPECDGCGTAGRCERQCACACRSETGDPRRPGPVLCWHQSMVEEIARASLRAQRAEAKTAGRPPGAYEPLFGAPGHGRWSGR